MVAHRLRLFLGLLCLPAIALPATARAQSNYVSPDNSLALTYPNGWKAEMVQGKLRLTAPDGGQYVVKKDAVFPLPTGDPAQDKTFREAAEKFAVPLLGPPEFVSVRALPVEKGSGAIFRFQEKAKAGKTPDTADVWLIVSGEHSAAIAPEKVNQADQGAALESILKSVAFAAAVPPAPGNRPAGNGNGKNPAPGNKPGTRPGNPANPLARPGNRPALGLGAGLRPGRAAMPAGQPEPNGSTLETYSGHLMPRDYAFTLRLMRDGTATAKWSSSLEQEAQFTGTYKGELGNYIVDLKQATGSNMLGVSQLRLALTARGGTQTGQFSTDLSSSNREIASLQLTEIGMTGKMPVGKPGNANRMAGGRLQNGMNRRLPNGMNNGRNGRNGQNGRNRLNGGMRLFR